MEQVIPRYLLCLFDRRFTSHNKEQLQTLSLALEPSLKLLHQKTFYSEPRFHASIAWALLSKSNTSLVGTPTSLSQDVDANSSILAHPIPVFSPSFLPTLVAKFGASFVNTKTSAFEVDRISVKIGKEVFTWSLGEK